MAIRGNMDGYEIEESVDRLSELPNSLILLILSFLPMRDVVSTTFLSKRWENLWTTVPCLKICDTISEDEDGAQKFRNFVNRALMLWEGTEIQKFEIDIRPCFDASLASDLDLWVRWAVKNRAEELSIRLMYEDMDWVDDAVMSSESDVYSAPRCLSTCTSIKKLSLIGCSLRTHGSPTWDKLKSLKMDGFCFSEQMINGILSGSPRLEEFELRLLESYDNLNIRSRSLKKLKIEKYLHFESAEASVDDHDTVLRICSPNLETLEISGCLYSKYLFTDVSSLTDATLGFAETAKHQLLGEALRQILPTIQRVENLALSVYSSEVLGKCQRKKLVSALPNVKFLKLSDDSLGGIEYGDVMNVLEISPNIKTLVIDDHNFMTSFGYPPQFDAESCFEFETDLPNSFLLQLKTIQIMSPFRTPSICRIIVFLLRHASMLEKLLIQTKSVKVYPQVFSFTLMKMLSSLQRSSPTAKVTIQHLSC